MSEAEAVRIRGLLWPAELLELRAVYAARVRLRPTAAAMAVLGVLHDSARRGERVEQDELARRAGAGTGTVVRVLGHLRAAGVVASEGGEFVPRRGKATCQRHRLTAAPALLAVTTPDRQLRLRAYAWLTTEGRLAPDDARALLRTPAWQRELWRRLREHRRGGSPGAVLNNRVEPAAVPNTAAAPASSCALPGGTDSWGTSATLEGFALQVAPVPIDPDRDRPSERITPATPATPIADPRHASGGGRSAPDRRGRGWVDLAVLVAAVEEAARRVGEQDLPRTAAALYGIALREHRSRPRDDPLRAMAAAYARGAAEAVDEAQQRGHRPGCAPLRDLAGLAFHVARRELCGEGPPPWPRRPRRVMPAASRAPVPAPRPPLVGPRRDAESGQEARKGFAAMSAAEEEAAWKALSAEERERAEAAARRKYPDLAEHTLERGHVWRLTVLGAVHRPWEDPVDG